MITHPRAKRLRSLVLAFLAAVSMGGVVAVVTSVASPQPALAANAGGLIPKSIVKWRADWWLANYGAIYSQSQANAKFGPDGDEKYRPDCSGFVSMAWHLPKLSNGSDLSTGNFWHRSGTFANGVAVSSVLSHVAISSLQPGDAIVRHTDDPWDGHIRLFDGWANASQTEYWAYEEYGTGLDARRTKFTTPSGSTWRGVRYSKIQNASSLSVTEYCTYQVTSGSVIKRSGNGTGWTGEGRYNTNATFLASTQTSGSWRRVGNGWVMSGDGGSFVLTPGGCTVA